MPVPKVFKRFASKTTLKADKGTVATPNVPANRDKDASSKTLVMATVVPTYSENITEAWVAAHNGLPKAQGVEKLLNHVGAPVGGGLTYFLILK